MKSTALKNRIVGRATVKASTLKPHPLNFRLHPEPQRRALEHLLSEVGWVQDVIVNKTTGFILNGHLRVDIAAKRDETVPVVYVKLTAAEEKLMLASLDPTGAMAITDDETLASLLAEVSTKDEGLLAMLEGMLGEAKLETPQAVAAPAGAESGDRASPVGYMGNKKAQIKPVLYADQVLAFEEALRLSGQPNRGKALMEICDFYIQSHSK